MFGFLGVWGLGGLCLCESLYFANNLYDNRQSLKKLRFNSSVSYSILDVVHLFVFAQLECEICYAYLKACALSYVLIVWIK